MLANTARGDSALTWGWGADGELGNGTNSNSNLYRFRFLNARPRANPLFVG